MAGFTCPRVGDAEYFSATTDDRFFFTNLTFCLLLSNGQTEYRKKQMQCSRRPKNAIFSKVFDSCISWERMCLSANFKNGIGKWHRWQHVMRKSVADSANTDNVNNLERLSSLFAILWKFDKFLILIFFLSEFFNLSSNPRILIVI